MNLLKFKFYIEAAATPMTAAEYVTYQTDTAEALRTKVLADPKAPSALVQLAADATTWDDAYLAALTQAGLLRAQDEPPAVSTSPQVDSFMAVINAGFLGGPSGPAQSLPAYRPADRFFGQVSAVVRQQHRRPPDLAEGQRAAAASASSTLHLSNPTPLRVVYYPGQSRQPAGGQRPDYAPPLL